MSAYFDHSKDARCSQLIHDRTDMNGVCLFAALMSFQASLCAKNTACTQRTLSHHCCQFPFYYKKTKYKRCTSHGDAHGRFWCATDYKYDKNSTGWGYCKLKESQCLVKTTDGNCCIFPFKYRGIEYTNCVTKEGKSPGLHWCATRPEFDKVKNGSGWGYCAGTTCFTCRSTESWEQCNKNLAKKTCPYGIEHCATISRQEPYGFQESANSSNNTTKVFTKDCALHTDCYKWTFRCNGQSSGSERCTYACCHGDLCNGGRGSIANSNASLVSVLAVMSAIKFAVKERVSFA